MDAGSIFSIALSPEQSAALLEAVRTADSQNVFVDALADIDVAKAQAGKEEDRVMILRAVQGSEGGTDRLNSMATAEMRKWAVSTLQAAAHAWRAEGGQWAGMHNVALVLQGLGHRDEALGLLEEELCHHEESEFNGPAGGSLEVLTTKGALANLLLELGRLDEAVALHKQVVAGKEAALGAEHSSTLGTKGNLAYQTQGLLNEAETLTLEVCLCLPSTVCPQLFALN